MFLCVPWHLDRPHDSSVVATMQVIIGLSQFSRPIVVLMPQKFGVAFSPLVRFPAPFAEG